MNYMAAGCCDGKRCEITAKRADHSRGRWMVVAPTPGEWIRAAAGVTDWATDAKSRSELGYAPRDLEPGLRTLLRADPALYSRPNAMTREQ